MGDGEWIFGRIVLSEGLGEVLVGEMLESVIVDFVGVVF